MTPEQYEDIFKRLDVRCYNCKGSGQIQLEQKYGPPRASDCDICYGTGYQCAGAGVELLNFLLRQRKRINQTAREQVEV